MSYRSKGFTLVELMITVVIAAIGVALAVPSWTYFIEKREVTASTEEFANFINFARTEAIKRNEEVTLSWHSDGGHDDDWCIGLSIGTAVCDCEETRWGQTDFCTLDETHTATSPHNIFTQETFVSDNYDLLHTNANLKDSSFSFDPVRGTLSNVPSALATELAADDYLFYLHSDSRLGGSRYFEMQVRVNMTGRVQICTDDDRKSIIGGYPVC